MARKPRTSTETTKTFSERLSECVDIKKNTGLSQKEIASQLGIASGTLSEWCADNVTPPIDVLPKLANYFEVSADWLIGLSDVASRNENIQNIHYETGLSYEAIERLRDMRKELKDTLEFLDSIIRYREVYVISRSCNEVKEAKIRYENRKVEYEKNKEKFDTTETSYDEFSDVLYSIVRENTFKALMDFQRYIDKSGK